MSTSYPFMAVARMRGLDYGLVLRIADHIEGKQKASQRDQDCCGMSDWRWINDTCQRERERRRTVKENG